MSRNPFVLFEIRASALFGPNVRQTLQAIRESIGGQITLLNNQAYATNTRPIPNASVQGHAPSLQVTPNGEAKSVCAR